jgi:ubiquitin-like-conjugating enzyme ATG3
MEEAFRLFKATREYLTPVVTESAFNVRGMLTPVEFVRAGDQLVRTCPSWQWETGEKSKIKPYLPANKQYLSTNGVPSYRRLSVLQSSKLVEDTVKGEMGEREGDWCAPELLPPNDNDESEDTVLVDAEDATADVSSLTLASTPAEKPTTKNDATTVKPSVKKEDDYEDMEDASLALDEATTVNPTYKGDSSLDAQTGSNIMRSRRYDVSITYDNYYRTPRIWLFGYDENGSTLSTSDIFQDIMQDYAQKTVTIDPHPHLSRPHASVHPCQHAPAMLRIVEALKECGDVPSVDQYLFIFLKFIQSVIPTIEYDYTVDVQVRGADGGDQKVSAEDQK